MAAKKHVRTVTTERSLRTENSWVSSSIVATTVVISFYLMGVQRENMSKRIRVTFDVAAGLDHLDGLGYGFQSATIDGRKGMIQLLEARYPGLPIQLCQFHQAQTIQRYTTKRPKTDCGLALRTLMYELTTMNQSSFNHRFDTWCGDFEKFLKERNDNGQFKHRHLRSARRSSRTNRPYLFTYKHYPDLQLPNTTNSCDGSFAHWKQRLKIHRGLRPIRRNKVINYLLSQ